MALVRKPTVARDPDEGEGFSHDQFIRPTKTVAPTRNDELAPTQAAASSAAPAMPAPPVPPPAPAPAPLPAPTPAVPEREVVSAEVARALRPQPKFVGRTTPFDDLDLPHEVQADPDARRYFNYMRLFAADQVPGGLQGAPFDRARQTLMAGRWGRRFPYQFEALMAEGLVGSRVLLASRFNGMLPVYKAWAGMFRHDRDLKAAMLEDLQLFVRHLRDSGRFPPFAYRVV